MPVRGGGSRGKNKRRSRYLRNAYGEYNNNSKKKKGSTPNIYAPSKKNTWAPFLSIRENPLAIDKSCLPPIHHRMYIIIISSNAHSRSRQAAELSVEGAANAASRIPIYTRARGQRSREKGQITCESERDAYDDATRAHLSFPLSSHLHTRARFARLYGWAGCTYHIHTLSRDLLFLARTSEQARDARTWQRCLCPAVYNTYSRASERAGERVSERGSM